MEWVELLTENGESRILALLAVTFATFMLLRIVVKYQKEFISTQDEEIEDLRKEAIQLREANAALHYEVLELRTQTRLLYQQHEQCREDNERTAAEIAALREEIALLRGQQGFS